MENIARSVRPIDFDSEMKQSYTRYAMSVIVGRALPDVRDGLKPVHRRILYAMLDQGMQPDRNYQKCAATVGEVIKSYHPHGDSAVYDTLVRMAQDFSLRYPLVDGQGNFGSVDGDPPAAYRYTESRLSHIAMELLRDIEQETVDFADTFDGSTQEPTVLPCVIPNLLANGSQGIAVGMATNIPPHNIGELCDAVIALIENPEVGWADLMKLVPGPDFPTGGLILGTSGIREAYETGRGSVTMQARAVIEPMDRGGDAILVTEIPYQVNKATLVAQIAKLYRDKAIEGISDMRDESDQSGMRIVIELRRDANPNVVLNQLYKHTQMRQNFGIIMLALVDRQPKVMGLKELLQEFVKHRQEVIVRRTQYQLRKAEERAHILEGFRIVLDNLDAVIALIRRSANREEARKGLIEKFGLSDAQSQAVLNMQLGQLTRLDQDKIEAEYQELLKKIEYLNGILADPRKVLFLIQEDMRQIKKDYGDERRTVIHAKEAADISIEDLIAEEEMIITITRDGYIKRLPIDTYRTQGRGGRGVIALTKKEQDSVADVIVATTHHTILFFTNRGRVYQLKAYQIPAAGRQSRGTAMVNLLLVEKDELVTATVLVPDFKREGLLFMTTRRGVVKKTDLAQFDTRLSKGIIAINLNDDDELRWVEFIQGDSDIILGTRQGMSIRFPDSDVRCMGRPAAGVRGVSLGKDDCVIGMDVVRPNAELLVVSERGYGKRTKLDQYRVQSRGGKGIITMRVTEKNGPVVDLRVVEADDELLVITKSGIIIRQRVANISVVGRSTQGVRLIRLSEDDAVGAVAPIVAPAEDSGGGAASAVETEGQ
ncbi:MAG: DNA gyrase subunit A [Armatimonadetes bacterium CG2_30_66_41]|nr:DNA gyrase subunit A [Armatimonadota bacterium]OIP00089.1 MAG: DNA gyrase subunit A [Armatimonadetes bacterium CG2_30_66_41]PIU94746.1 MAG: DNA gyrase subunit A [Armatimonadetes bacterium CG06_land_8_20_14_3_00_66_21]PIX49825.1 MAG: DNA gyrase subunit A [Armatimonadetes bacterium CG_4_8_14_3_um_filter_66_20]PJB76244.1 MAG: DNA gyrase subunit A [Armatimonadetes bacterium CG_4_9_14_3_um_filter_66_14]